MNIFVLDTDPQKAAQMLCDKHVGKMLLESVQLLCNGLPGAPYRPTHTKHPASVWTHSSPNNMTWVFGHATYLSHEYYKRFGKMHKSSSLLSWIAVEMEKSGMMAPNFSSHGFIYCGPEQYRTDDVIESYRNYYVGEKSRFAKWERGTGTPDWYIQKVFNKDFTKVVQK